MMHEAQYRTESNESWRMKIFVFKNIVSVYAQKQNVSCCCFFFFFYKSMINFHFYTYNIYSTDDCAHRHNIYIYTLPAVFLYIFSSCVFITLYIHIPLTPMILLYITYLNGMIHFDWLFYTQYIPTKNNICQNEISILE